MTINRITENSRVNKCFNKDFKDSTVENNTLNNDCLLPKKCDIVIDTTHSNLVMMKPLSSIKFENPYNSCLTNLNSLVNTENQSYLMTQTLKMEDNMESTQNIFQPTAEPIQVKGGEEYEFYGMIQLISIYKFIIFL